jgi:nicotinamidase-related amidase
MPPIRHIFSTGSCEAAFHETTPSNSTLTVDIRYPTVLIVADFMGVPFGIFSCCNAPKPRLFQSCDREPVQSIVDLNHMPGKNFSSADSEPTAPDHDRARGRAALIILDMINDFDFLGSELLEPRAYRIAQSLAVLRVQFEAAGLPVIYVNDNFGEWHSERSKLIERAVAAGSRTTRTIAPRDEDYFIIKPKFSGFYATNLAVLLPKLGVSRLILTGVAADMCVLFTAADAHMRDYALWVPSDLVAGEDETRAAAALAIMEASMGAETLPTTRLDLTSWLRRLDRLKHA